MMLLAVGFLQQGDEDSLRRADGYITRVVDRVEKATPEEESGAEVVSDWRERQAKLRTVLYYLRGEVEQSQKDFAAAAKDLEMSYSIQPNGLAAELLGEIDELKKDTGAAVEEYTLAFVLPENGPTGKVDRREVRNKLGNVWRQMHGSDQGLGEEILAAYDPACKLLRCPPIRRRETGTRRILLISHSAAWTARLRRLRRCTEKWW